ncbi:hypothetical protein QOZ80_2BG0194320 [Eleusine coracana subsp. coracana]|nr:hypothetical protein QOZ80_2BG0194320 [Eleusine coracana subsp. coracana]
MGLCFSKKKKPPPGATSKKAGKVAAAVLADDKAKKTAPQAKVAADKNAVKAKVVTPGSDEKKKKRAPQDNAAKQPLPVAVLPSAPVRTSSCTREEVDAILIQCGRLSRSSSGTGRTPSRETGSHHRRRRSGSKRSYDFDQERKTGDEEGDWESGRPVSRPSPQRKRSGSRERSSGGGSGSRRASRSPGRRGAEGGMPSVSGGERGRQQQPGKMVSVPAREKTRAPSPAAAAAGIRCASPRSSSPARMVAAVGNENACGVPALSRSSSRKAEQSPYRRNPMAEIDENTLRNTTTNNNAKPQKKFSDNTVPAAHQKAMERVKDPTVTASARSGNEKRETAEDPATAAVVASEARPLPAKTNTTRTAESLSQRPRSRRASRDFDQGSSNSYASQILEDIQNYHNEQHQASATPPSFSLPACVAKACSILDAVADLDSSSSSANNNNDYSADDKGSVNAAPTAGTSHARRRHVAALTAAEAEPQESAGSNSVSAIPCTPSWEPASVESSDRTWSDEVVDQSCGGSHGGAPSPAIMNRPRQSSKQSGVRSRAGSSGNGSNSLHRGRSGAHRASGSVASGRSGVRAVSAAS